MIVEVVSIAALLFAGFGLAAPAFVVPDVGSTSTAATDIAVSVEGGTDVEAHVYWFMASDGHVTLRTEAYDNETQSGIDLRVTVTLYCDARLENMDDHGAAISVDVVGSACTEPGELYPPDPQRQIIILGSDAYLEGEPIGRWNDSAGASRLARTPSIRWDNFDLADASTLHSGVSGIAGELLDTIDPESVKGESPFGGNTVEGQRGQFERLAAFWTAEYFEALEPKVTRWTRPGVAERNQWLVLISGALLGVAASIAVETLKGLMTTRARNRSESASTAVSSG